jgi:hypothetical protein
MFGLPTAHMLVLEEFKGAICTLVAATGLRNSNRVPLFHIAGCSEHFG